MMTCRLYLQNICILIIGVLNILNHFLPGRYLELSIKLADHYKLPLLLLLSLLLHGGVSASCQLGEKCTENFAKQTTFVLFSCAITMKLTVIIHTLLQRNGHIQRCRKLFNWKSNQVQPRASSSPSVRFTAEHSDSNIVSIEFQPSQQEENTERPESCESRSQAYHGMKHHLVSFRTGLLYILTMVVVGLAVNVYYTKIDKKFHSSEFYYFLYVFFLPIYSTVAVITNDNLRNYSKYVLVRILNTLF